MWALKRSIRCRSPSLCDHLAMDRANISRRVRKPDLQIDDFIVPIRDLVEAATLSGAAMQRDHQGQPRMAEQLRQILAETFAYTPGGIIYSLPARSGSICRHQFHQLVAAVAEAATRLIFPVFPRIVLDWEYRTAVWSRYSPRLSLWTWPALRTRNSADHVEGPVLGEAKPNTAREMDAPPAELRYPSPAEVDNIALRRELTRLRKNLPTLLPSARARKASLVISRLTAPPPTLP